MRYERPVYLGCANNKVGHYVFGVDSRTIHPHWLECMDGKFPPEGDQTEGIARLHHLNGCTVLAFWDRSVDKRPGSNIAFVAPGRLTFDEAVAAAKRNFPHVWPRFKFEVVAERAEHIAENGR